MFAARPGVLQRHSTAAKFKTALNRIDFSRFLLSLRSNVITAILPENIPHLGD